MNRKKDLAQMLETERKERTQRAAQAIEEICKRENVSIVVTALVFNNGALVPQIQITPL